MIRYIQPQLFEFEENLLTTKEAITFLHTSRTTLYRIMKTGKLVRYRVGGTLRFSRSDLINYVRSED